MQNGSRIIVKAVLGDLADPPAAPMFDVSVRDVERDTFEFTVSSPVAAPASEIYALIDWADARNKWRQTGDDVTCLDAEGRKFRLVVSYMPGVEFDHEVEEASSPHLYAYSAVANPRQGRLEWSRSRYEIADDDQGAVVTYTMTARYTPGLSEHELAVHVRLTARACHNTMSKLKANAEHGVGTPEAFEATVLMGP